ncbi:ferredoxin reductase-like protein [Viridothelium virens]|uniref:Oxidoreductase NAD-binding domain-containing protein 1 n=1 Tax=Viridothelium virens TaxID=1048519 RepID=A0A6A6H8H0_VIRVR|nr:ferredoxin reductase-like protein [Viridothelium virens]
MAAVREKLSHEERTAAEPREDGLHPVKLNRIEQVNESIRLLRLSVLDHQRGVKFLPGQWLDIFIPGLPKAGGFTITSIPRDAEPVGENADKADGRPYLELAVQNSPKNPPAARLWRPSDEILGTQLVVRVGGSFVFPPLGVPPQFVKRLVIIAGGVGINPLISILAHLHYTNTMPPSVQFLYSTKIGQPSPKLEDVLFLDRLRSILKGNEDRMRLSLFITGQRLELETGSGIDLHYRRIGQHDLREALGPVSERRNAFCYVCGPQGMTDELVARVRNEDSVVPDQVLCEKWW